MEPRATVLPDGRIWLRLADPEWDDPLDASYSETRGGRWNPPGAFAVLYLNADLETARLQVRHFTQGTSAEPEDLRDDALLLVPVEIAADQRAADAVTDEGLRALDLPVTYPLQSGTPIPHTTCQARGVVVFARGLHGVLARSALGSAAVPGTELAWFTRGTRAQEVYRRMEYGEWRDGESWGDLGLPEPTPLGLGRP